MKFVINHVHIINGAYLGVTLMANIGTDIQVVVGILTAIYTVVRTLLLFKKNKNGNAQN